jgi:predicted lipid-binding transport protein (Tim44 family)
MKIWQLVCGSLLVLNMTGCGNNTPTTPSAENSPAPEAATSTAASPATEAAPAATPAATAPATEAAPATATASGFPGIKAVIAASKKAGEAGDFDAATTEFSKFEDAWKTVEDGVKSKSAANYKGIEDAVEAANMAVAKKDKPGFIASLGKISGLVDKSSK